MPALTLVNVVLRWIQEDPLLKKHITYTPDDPSGQGDGVYLGCCTLPRHVPYAIAVVYNKNQYVATWEWAPWEGEWTTNSTPGIRKNITDHLPGDPQFFEKLKVGLIVAHNSMKVTNGCNIV